MTPLRLASDSTKAETHELNTPLLHTVQQGGVSLDKFDVTYHGNIVGSVCTTREGLYTRFQCTCHLPDNEIYRLLMTCGEGEQDLGVLIPDGQQFAVNKRLQNKYITNKEMAFQIIPSSRQNNEKVFSISSDKPFDHIPMLEYARLSKQNGSYQIMITDQPRSK